MSDPETGEHRDDEGGMPVGRLAAERARTSTPGRRPAPRNVLRAALPLIILALVAGLGIGLAIGFLVGGGSEEAATTTAAPTTTVPAGGSTTTSATGTTTDDLAWRALTITGDPLPALQQGAEDTAVGLPVPEITGTDYAGNPYSLAADGLPKLVVALAHWCPYCNQELPVLRDWYDAGNVPEGVEFIMLSVFVDSSRANFPPGTWLADNDWTGPVIADDINGSIERALGITAVPYHLLVAPDGTVVGRVTGALPVEQLDSIVESLANLSSTTTAP